MLDVSHAFYKKLKNVSCEYDRLGLLYFAAGRWGFRNCWWAFHILFNVTADVLGLFIFCSTLCVVQRNTASWRFVAGSVTADVFDRGGRSACCIFFFIAPDLSTFVLPLANPRCEAAPRDLVMHTRKGNVAHSTSGASPVVSTAAGASISTIVILLFLQLRPQVLRGPRPAHLFWHLTFSPETEIHAFLLLRHNVYNMRIVLLIPTQINSQTSVCCDFWKIEKRQLWVWPIEWLKLNFASCVIHQTRALGVVYAIFHLCYGVCELNLRYGC